TRITAAKELMASTDLKVYEISDKVGFDSAFYFSKVFKKLEGVSPREYMQRMKVSYVDAKDEATV
ncbi:MAG TPA: helix-turn-helix transcriptional regulator, partial [Gemmiger formicilis]|nr:helix-turn-helix transcriptional regulator [Gemmiger formicilis]